MGVTAGTGISFPITAKGQLRALGNKMGEDEEI
jgi:hypothetical protein